VCPSSRAHLNAAAHAGLEISAHHAPSSSVRVLLTDDSPRLVVGDASTEEQEECMPSVRKLSLAAILIGFVSAPLASWAAVGGRVRASAATTIDGELSETLVLTPLTFVSRAPVPESCQPLRSVDGSPVAGQAAGALVGAFLGTALGALIRRERRS
jgi:hypothetical protein